MGYDARLWEEPGQGHWWDLHPDIPGADCVDGLRIRSFLREHVRNPFPSHVTLVSYDLGNNNKMYWVRVDEEINPIGLVQVDAELDGSVLTCTTQNAKQITFDFGNGFPYGAPSRIMIDGNLVSDVVPDSSGLVTLTKSDDGWRMGTDSPSFLNRTPNFRGPMKRAYFSPFILVVGTIGPPELNQYNLELARTTAQRWWYRANGYTQIIRDLDMPWEIAADHNLILIGGPFANGWSTGFCENGYLDSIPLAIDDTGVRIGSEFIAGEDLACKFVYPNPLNPERLILAEWATWDSLDGMRLAGGLNCMYSGSGLPDFLVYDKSVRLTGYAGVYAAGFFDNNWKLNPEFYYIRSSSQSSPTNPWVP
jgi:hypothetical protein